jgi:hypothetical protein
VDNTINVEEERSVMGKVVNGSDDHVLFIFSWLVMSVVN